MENQNNNKDKNEMRTRSAEGGAPHVAGGRRNQNHHRGNRGRGGHKGTPGQEVRTVTNSFGADAATAESKSERTPMKGTAGRDGGRQGSEQKGQGVKHNRNRCRGGDHRDREQNRTKGEAAATAERLIPTTPETGPQNFSSAAIPFRTVPTVDDRGLDDIFSPLHEVEVNDPAAEETARRILDAEGPLLFDGEAVEDTATAEDEKETVEIVGIRFKTPGKMYYFAPDGLKLARGSYAIVETTRGEEFGEVCCGNTRIPITEVVQPLSSVLRAATDEDIHHNACNKKREDDAFRICQEKIAEHGLEMKLVEAQYTFDNSKLLFYFTSDGRVDFRELVKDLAGVFRTRIELRQIGIRDEAKLLGGLGTCGRPLCCAGFLSDFVQVSIKMAKEQNLSLNSAKISGCCGRLMCCLRYEFDTYEKEIRMTPSVGSTVETPDGRGDVIANHPLRGTVTVRLTNLADEAPRVYHRDLVRVCGKERSASGMNRETDEQEQPM